MFKMKSRRSRLSGANKVVLPRFPLVPDRNMPAVLQSLGDSLTSYPEIRALQVAVHAMLRWGQSIGLPEDVGVPAKFLTSAGEADGKYGPATHEGVRRMAKVGILIGHCRAGHYLPRLSEIDTLGPNAAAGCLKGPWLGPLPFGGELVYPVMNAITDAILAKAQTAWNEWREILRSPSPPAEATEEVEETEELTDAEILDIQEGTGPGQDEEDEGMSTAAWIALFIGGAVLAGGIYYVVSD